jgi:hypothetical protein
VRGVLEYNDGETVHELGESVSCVTVTDTELLVTYTQLVSTIYTTCFLKFVDFNALFDLYHILCVESIIIYYMVSRGTANKYNNLSLFGL